MKISVPEKSTSAVYTQRFKRILFMSLTFVMCKLHAQMQQKECDIRMNAVVSSSGNLSNDGKGTYYTGADWVGIWLNPTRWDNQSFHICMNWPFNYFKTCDSATAPAPTGIR